MILGSTICSRKDGNRRSFSSTAVFLNALPQTMPSALQADGLYKAFGSTRALQGASLSVEGGQVHALLGENGSGKSTFAKILAGVQRADYGTVYRKGRAVRIDDPAAARAVGIAMVFQELSLAPDLDIVDNIFLGREWPAKIPVLFDRRREEVACRAILDQLGLRLDPRLLVRTLGMAQRQMLEIGKALSQEPNVLILDEPTASLTRREIEQLFTVIKRLRDTGIAILYVTHHLREVLEIADHVSIMRDGRIVAELAVTPKTTEEELIGLLVGRAPNLQPAPLMASAREPLLEVTGLRIGTRPGVSFHVDGGEIVGLYGVVGCGREQVGRALIGLHPIAGGSFTLNGQPYVPTDPADALEKGVGFLSSDRKQEGILPNRSIRENLMLSNLRAVARFGFIEQRAERRAAVAELSKLGVKYGATEHVITTLSGGNQQKLLFGRALSAKPDLLVLEDPTAGIDIGAKLDLYRIIRAHVAREMSFLWMSSDLTETLTLCDRVYAMYDGRIVSEIVAPTMADEDHLLAAVLGRGGAVRWS
jgi:ribose transport system ATP-binding protein